MKTLASLLLLACASVLAAPAPAPEQIVERFHATLLENMRQGGALGCEGRMERLRPVVRETFDVPDLSRRVLRRRWTELNDAQRAQFTDALEELIVTTYAREFHAYDGERFATVESAPLPGGRGTLRQVRTLLSPAAGEPVTLDYALHATPAGWRVINVVAGGVSDLALRSAQYEAGYKTGGYDALIDGLRAQATRIRSQCPAAAKSP